MDTLPPQLPVLGDHLGHHRRSRVTGSRARTHNHAVRAAAKRHAQLDDPVNTSLPFGVGRLENLTNSHGRSYTGGRLRPALEEAIHTGVRQSSDSGGLQVGRGRVRRLNGTSDLEQVAEGRDLARSDVPLPSDRARRCLSLDRQDAFCDADTFKRTLSMRRADPVGNEDEQIAALYSMGLLYDDSLDAGYAPFDLNSVRHEDPVPMYAIRPAKRSRRSRPHTKQSGPNPLNLDLSFADLGSDEAIARLSDGRSYHSADNGITRGEVPHRTPMRVIYELVGSRGTYDVDTSQPPDLIEDDYDYFSDAELSDGPAEREVEQSRTSDRSSGGAPEPWVMLG